MRISPPQFAIIRTQLKYYVCGDESRRAQNAIIEFANAKKQSFYYAFKCGPTVIYVIGNRDMFSLLFPGRCSNIVLMAL